MTSYWSDGTPLIVPDDLDELIEAQRAREAGTILHPWYWDEPAIVPDRDEGPLPYVDFRSGYSFADVATELAAESRARNAEVTGDYMFVTRHTVLGRMRQYKRAAYVAYLQDFPREQWPAWARDEAPAASWLDDPDDNPTEAAA